MISHMFDYQAPARIEDAFSCLDRSSSNAVLAGGTWLIPNMTYGTHQPSLVLDAKHLGLNFIRESADEIILGALSTYEQVRTSDVIRAHVPLLGIMADQITGGPQIVRQGTVGGSACYANPSSDVPACLAVLKARLRLMSVAGVRDVSAENFFEDAFRSVRRPDELLTEIVLPKIRDLKSVGYHKLKFSAGSWPIVTAACVRTFAHDGVCKVRIGIGGANRIPVCYEASLQEPASCSDIGLVASRAPELITEEWSDELAGSGYRREVAASVVAKAIVQCMDVA